MTRKHIARLCRFAFRKALFGCLSAILLLLPIRTLAANQTPLTYFEVYYQNLLEFSTCATMTINGLVYCNSNIDVGPGSDALLNFTKTVASAGTIMAPANNGASWGNATNYSSSWNTSFNGSPSNIVNLPPLQLSVPMTNYHDLIDIPADNDPTTPVGQQLLYNQAQVILVVSNFSSGSPYSNVVVSLKIQKAPTPVDIPGADSAPLVFSYTNPTPASLSNTIPFLSLTNRFYDIRERTTNYVTQIDVGLYKKWLTNGPASEKFPVIGNGGFPTILYVADFRKTNSLHQLMVVRLINGIAPPVNGNLGFSVATPNPLYVLGNYNCTNAALLGTTNTSSGVTRCAFYCDAFTVLSSAWSDLNSLNTPFGSGTGWNANDTTINSAVVAGIVPSTGVDNVHFSGGLHNLPRLLEDWSGNVLWLNTSLINLYNSTRATGQFLNPGTYYNPPTRKFSFDGRYGNPNVKPPGMPDLSIGSPLVFVSRQSGMIPAGGLAKLTVFSAVGYGPLTYQWNLNGTNIDGATNTSFSLANIQSQDAGTYTVTVTDGIGTSTNPVADFTVMDIKPFLWRQPSNQFALVGSDVTFTASASGTTPMNWQWQFNSTNLDDATNSALVLTNLTVDQAGVYSVIVTNSIGSTLSSNAVLSVYTSAVPTMDSVLLSTNNQIQFTINGAPGLGYAVQASTDLVNWDSIQTNISPFDYTDTNTANLPQRYYRVIYLP